MNDLQDLLSGLRDIHTPDAVSFWPPAPGWWVLATMLFILLVYAIWRSMPWLRSLHYRYEALRKLQTIYNSKPDTARMLIEINITLRRLARAAYPENYASSLTGIEWLKFLDNSAKMRGFSHGAGKALAQEPYRPHPKARMEALYQLAKQWIQRHQVQRDSYLS